MPGACLGIGLGNAARSADALLSWTVARATIDDGIAAGLKQPTIVGSTRRGSTAEVRFWNTNLPIWAIVTIHELAAVVDCAATIAGAGIRIGHTASAADALLSRSIAGSALDDGVASRLEGTAVIGTALDRGTAERILRADLPRFAARLLAGHYIRRATCSAGRTCSVATPVFRTTFLAIGATLACVNRARAERQSLGWAATLVIRTEATPRTAGAAAALLSGHIAACIAADCPGRRRATELLTVALAEAAGVIAAFAMQCSDRRRVATIRAAFAQAVGTDALASAGDLFPRAFWWSWGRGRATGGVGIAVASAAPVMAAPPRPSSPLITERRDAPAANDRVR